jgi:hypothetical protein
MDSRNGYLDMIHWHYSLLRNDIHRCTYYADRCDQGNSHCPHDKSLKQSTKQLCLTKLKLTNVLLIMMMCDTAANDDDHNDKDKQQHQ